VDARTVPEERDLMSTTSIFLTGGSGLIGSNICEQLLARGDEVTALVRPGTDASELEAIGVRIARGDITVADDVLRAAEGCESAIHSAAVLGGASQDPAEHARVNTGGVRNVFDAVAAHGMRRVVTLGTTTYFDFETEPLSERSALHPNPAADPYTQSKRLAFIEAMERAEAGLDVCVVIPGGTFGPAPCVARSMEAPSYNLRIVLAAKGEFTESVSFPIPWSFAVDVAGITIAALDRGVSGEKYLAFTRAEDVGSMAMFVNRAMEIAGLPERVDEITVDRLDADPDLQVRIGPSLVALARQTFPSPYFTAELTRTRLGHRSKTLDEALAVTVEWLRVNGLME
jgi:dihydroflavonol-4-reductase